MRSFIGQGQGGTSGCYLVRFGCVATSVARSEAEVASSVKAGICLVVDSNPELRECVTLIEYTVEEH